MRDNSSQDIQSRIQGQHIPALDAVRGIAALMVVFTHMGLLPRQFGALGVAIFFVLSGFLITWLLLRENDQAGDVSLRNFYVRRTLRIFPAFYVFWAVSICATILRGAKIPWPEAWAAFFYVGDYFAALGLGAASGTSTIMGITWSLGVEEKFYLIWPWVFRKFRNNATILLRICLGTVVVVWIYRILVCLFLNVPRDYLRYAFEARLDNIMIGALAAVAVRYGVMPGQVTAMARWRAAPLLGVLLLIVSTLLGQHFPPAYHYVFGMTFESLVIVITLMQLIVVSDRVGWRWLEKSVPRFFGRISYSLYLYHLPVILMTEYLLVHSRWRVQLATELLFSIVLATLSYQLIEKPFLRLKRRFERVGV
jgi:peptidoglycan/LPS O-acetylase OafA/YrhL